MAKSNSRKPCKRSQVRNRKTGRCILKRNLKARKATRGKRCVAKKIRNPKTGRCILRRGAIGKRIMRERRQRKGYKYSAQEQPPRETYYESAQEQPPRETYYESAQEQPQEQPQMIEFRQGEESLGEPPCAVDDVDPDALSCDRKSGRLVHPDKHPECPQKATVKFQKWSSRCL